MDKAQSKHFTSLIEKRLTGYPVAYLLGTKAFWTLDLLVTPDVLIPRPETELLVETVLEKIQDINNPKILDLGTGSGAIALALASERSDARIIASDYSEKALIIAQKNADTNQLNQQVSFVKSDWFSNINDKDFDLIVSNPPYIDPNDPHLTQTIRHEPQQALVADNLGMKDIETIIENCSPFLKNGGWVLLEHGYNQSKQTLKHFAKHDFINGKTYLDINQNPRISIAQHRV